MNETINKYVRSAAIAPLFILMMLVASCSSGNSENNANGSKPGDNATDNKVGSEITPTSVARPETVWTGDVPPTKTEAEAAFTELLECYEEGGLSGWVRLDLERSYGMESNITVGGDEAEIQVNQLIIKQCGDAFDVVMEPYIAANPLTDEQREALRQRLLDCADEFFPGLVGAEISLDDLDAAYSKKLDGPAGRLSQAGLCQEEAWTGKPQFFGEQPT